MATLLISVVIPTRHRDDTLALCLERLRPGAQTFPAEQYEVIVTDDGSTSTAEAMIREKFPWVKWTAGPRKGPAANRNHGASLATGEWIAFTDDDCLPSLGWLSAFASAIRDGVQVYEGETTCMAGLKSPRMQAPINVSGGWLWSCNMMVRRSYFLNHTFDESFPYPHMEDVYFRELLKLANEPFVFIPAATIDHPPRRMASGRKWAATHECQIIYRYKMHEAQSSLAAYLTRLAINRLKAILAYPVSRDSFSALYHMVVECFCVIRWYNTWKRRNKAIAHVAGRLP